jgi:hypothetical protein
MASGTYSRFIAAQVWPLLMNAPPEQALGDRLRVDVGQHDGRVVAAKLQGEPGHVPRRRLDDLHPGLDRTGEHHLADARVADQGVAHVAGPGDGGQHAGAALAVVDEDLDGQRRAGGGPHPRGAARRLVPGAQPVHGLALLPAHHVGKLLGVRVDGVRRPHERGAALLVIQRGPAGLGFRGRVDRRRHVAGRAERDPSDHLAGRRVLDLRAVVRADAASRAARSSMGASSGDIYSHTVTARPA